MAYNQVLADRVWQYLHLQNLPVEEKRMMGGLTFMVKGKMWVGILNDDLLARIAPEDYATALTKKGCRETDFTGKPMIGFVFISPQGTDHDEDLHYWLKLALVFNERAKASKKSRGK